MEKISLLLLEDSELDAELTLAHLRRAGLDFSAVRVDCRAAFETAVQNQNFDLIISDYALPDFDGLAALAFTRQNRPDVPFIMLSGVLGEEHAIDALQRGATDYVLKPRLDRLAPAVERAIGAVRLETERRRAADELRRAQEFCRRVLESSRDSILTVGLDGKVMSVNPHALACMGVHDPAQGGDIHWIELWSDSHREEARNAFDAAAHGGAASFEAYNISPEREVRYWDVLLTPVLNSTGEPEQILSVARDITDRRRAEQERSLLLRRERQARAEAENKTVKLQQSIEDLEHFASIASHDLKEPLRTVAMYCQLLVRRYKSQLDTEAQEYLAYVEQGTRRMSLLLHDLLSYSRVVHDDDQFSLLDVNDVVQEALRNCAVAIEEAGATVHVGDLPTVRAHRPQIVQVLQNLIENAVKYRGSEPPRIEITCTQSAEGWEFCIQDNGIGFNPRYSDRIFGIFKRLHGEEYPGTGIGLAICRRVIERHHGRIWAHSEEGSGSRFCFTLPAHDSSAYTTAAGQQLPA